MVFAARGRRLLRILPDVFLQSRPNATERGIAVSEQHVIHKPKPTRKPQERADAPTVNARIARTWFEPEKTDDGLRRHVDSRDNALIVRALSLGRNDAIHRVAGRSRSCNRDAQLDGPARGGGTELDHYGWDVRVQLVDGTAGRARVRGGPAPRGGTVT